MLVIRNIAFSTMGLIDRLAALMVATTARTSQARQQEALAHDERQAGTHTPEWKAQTPMQVTGMRVLTIPC